MREQDYQTSVDFLAWLFADTEGPVELRAIRKLEAGGGAISCYTRDPETVVTFCRKFARPAYGTYAGIATRTAGTAKGDREHCTELPAVWADIDCIANGIDFDEAISALLSLPHPPSAIIHSGGGLHAYWRLREPLDLTTAENDEAVVAVLRQLIGVTCGDRSACDIPRVLRLPGTLNTKREPHVLCRVLHQDDRTYEFSDIVEWLDWQRPVITSEIGLKADPVIFSNPFLAAAARFGFKPPLDVEQALAAMSYEAPGENSIHYTQLRVSASMVSAGADDDEIVDVLLSATKAAAGQAGAFWNWAREERAIRGMIASAKVKFTPREERKPQREPAEVVSLAEARTRAQAKPKEKPRDDDPLIAKVGAAVLDTWQEHRPMLGRIDGELWCYSAGWWQPFDKRIEERLKVDIQTTIRGMRANPTSSLRSSVYHWITEHDSLDQAGSFADAEPVIVGRSSTLLLSSGAIVPHDPDHLARYAVDCEHDPLATCPTWNAFLASAFSDIAERDRDEVIAFLQEWTGCLLAVPAKREMRKALILYGPSRTGKTQVLRVFRALLGDCCSQLRLAMLDNKQDKFGMAAMFTKRGWIADDAIGPRDDLASEVFKQIVTGEPASVRIPGGNTIEHAFQIPVAMSANDLPRVRDTSDGVYNRLVVVRMSHVVPEGSEGAEEVHETVTRHELAGVIQWALEGRRRVLGRRRFVIPEAVASEVRALKDANNPIRAFVSRFWVPDEGYCVDRRDIWCLWCAWQEDEGDNATERWGKQTVFRMFEGAAECRPQDNAAGRVMYMGGRLTEQAIEMIGSFESRFASEKRKHGSGAGPASINRLATEFVKKSASQPASKVRF